MPSIEALQTVLSSFLIGASVVAMIFAVKETKGIPLKVFFSSNGSVNIAKKFFLFMGLSFIPLALLALIDGAHTLAALLIFLAVLQFRQSGLTPNNRDTDDNKT